MTDNRTWKLSAELQELTPLGWIGSRDAMTAKMDAVRNARVFIRFEDGTEEMIGFVSSVRSEALPRP